MIGVLSPSQWSRRWPWLGDWLRVERGAWLFVLKSLLALYLAAWLAMKFQLPQPSTSMVTVAIVMHPQSGMVLAKSFYRALGTLAGCAFGLLLIALFPQERVLFLLGLSLWVGLCAGGATLYRNFMSYGFVLAGYTAALVSLPVTSDPLGVFNAAVMRVSEVLLGLLVAGVVSDVVLPQRVRSVLRSATETQFDQFMGFIGDSLNGRLAREDMERIHLQSVRAAVRLEDLRSTVIFEDAEARARSSRISLANHYYLAASTSFQSLHHLINRLARGGQRAAAEALIALYRPLGAAVTSDKLSLIHDAPQLLQRLNETRRGLPAAAIQQRAALSDEAALTDFDTGASLLLRLNDELIELAQVTAQISAKRIRGSVERISFRRGNDVAGAGLAVLRTALTMGVLSVGWILSGWQAGLNTLLFATVFSGLFASLPQPLKVITHTLYGFVLGVVLGGVLNLIVLPMADGFLLLIAVSLPFMLLGPYMIAHPGSMGIGVGYSLALAFTVGLANPMTYNAPQLFNTGLAEVLGPLLTVVAFVFFPAVAGSAGQRRRLLLRLRRQMQAAAHDSVAGLAARFESTNADLVAQVITYTAPGSEDARVMVSWSLAVNECGRALIDLRRQLRQKVYPGAVVGAIQPVIDTMAALFDQPSRARWRDAEQAVGTAISAVIDSVAAGDAACRGLLDPLYMLRSTLRDDQSVLGQYMPASVPSSSEIPHAR